MVIEIIRLVVQLQGYSSEDQFGLFQVETYKR